MGIYLPSARILGSVVWLRAGIASSQSIPHSRGIPPYFYPSCVYTAPFVWQHLSQHHTASPHLSAHLRNSSPSTCLDECGFFKSLVVRLPYSLLFWQFWMLFVLRSSCNSFCCCVRRQACLPIPPSWLEVPNELFGQPNISFYLKFNKILVFWRVLN